MTLSYLNECYSKLDEVTKLRMKEDRAKNTEAFYKKIMEPIEPSVTYLLDNFKKYEAQIRKTIQIKKIIEKAKEYGIKKIQSLKELFFDNIFIDIETIITQLTLFKDYLHFTDTYINKNHLLQNTYYKTITSRP